MSDIKSKIKAGATIVDVRSKDEFNDGAYPGARNIPINQLMSRLDDVGPKDKAVILYCASGSRSSVALQMLKANGFTDVVNAGGLEDMPE